MKDSSRKLIFTDEENMIRFFLVKLAGNAYADYGLGTWHSRQGYADGGRKTALRNA